MTDRKISSQPGIEGKKIDLGKRLAEFLKSQYPEGERTGRIAQDFTVSKATAKNWLAGETPTVAKLELMATKWGRPFVEAVFQDILATDKDAQRVVAEMTGASLAHADEAAPGAASVELPEWVDHFRNKLIVEYGTSLIGEIDNQANQLLKKAAALVQENWLVEWFPNSKKPT